MTIKEVEHYLNGLQVKTGDLMGKNVTVQRMWPLLEKVGNPQDRLQVVHIAGTSGKTSTAYFIASMLHQTGKKVGLTVSPHISKLTERLQVNGKSLDDDSFCELFARFCQEIGENPDATYFELLVVFVLWAFVQIGVDYAVIETGLGGLHDGTNVCQRADKVCVITDIGYDHQNILGDTLEEIAAQKAGIIHRQNQVFMYHQSKVVDAIFHATSISKDALLHFVTMPKERQDSLLPLFQLRNWNLALQVYQYLVKRDKLVKINSNLLARTKLQVPGRMQEISLSGNRLFVLDGAHNEQKMQALVASFREKYGRVRVPVVLAIKQGKDYDAVVKTLAPIMSLAVCCGYNARQDMPISSASPEEIAQEVEAHAVQTRVFNTLDEAIIYVTNMKEPITLVTGSLYIIGDTIRLLQAKV
jgi:dihydrofolate synthase/folylpolyglutamate synthase